MTRFQRIKAWTKQHKVELVTVGMYTTLAASLVALGIVAVKAENASRARALANLNADIDQLNAWHRFEHAQILAETA